SGFGLGIQRGAPGDVTNHLVARHRSVFTRIAVISGDDRAAAEAKVTPKSFADGLKTRIDTITKIGKDVLGKTSSDAFEVAKAMTALRSAVKASSTSMDTLVLHSAFLERLDATLTEMQLAEGNRGDILQNVLWQIDLLTSPSALGKLDARSRIR